MQASRRATLPALAVDPLCNLVNADDASRYCGFHHQKRRPVQVPCIERNAIAAVKAVNAARMALRRTSEPRVCLDKVIETMYETGKDMNAKYRETSRGGLAMKIVACD